MVLALVSGEEDFLVEEKVRAFHASFPEMRLIDGADVSEENLLLALQSTGLFATNRSCEIRHAPWFVENSEKDSEEVAIEILKTLTPVENIIFSVYGNLSHRGPLTKFIRSHGEVFEYPLQPIWKNEERIHFIKNQAKEKGKILADDAAEYIVSAGVTTFRQLANEIEKLSIFVHPEKNITLEAAHATVSPGEAFAWQLSDALMQKDTSASMHILQKLVDAGQAPFALIPMLAKQFRMLLRYKMGLPPLGGTMSRGAEWRYKRASPKFSQPHVERILRRLLELDELFKRSSVSPFPLLTSFVAFVSREK